MRRILSVGTLAVRTWPRLRRQVNKWELGWQEGHRFEFIYGGISQRRDISGALFKMRPRWSCYETMWVSQYHVKQPKKTWWPSVACLLRPGNMAWCCATLFCCLLLLTSCIVCFCLFRWGPTSVPVRQGWTPTAPGDTCTTPKLKFSPPWTKPPSVCKWAPTRGRARYWNTFPAPHKSGITGLGWKSTSGHLLFTVLALHWVGGGVMLRLVQRCELESSWHLICLDSHAGSV